MRTAHGYALRHAESPVEPWMFERRDLRADDVAIKVTYCGCATATCTP